MKITIGTSVVEFRREGDEVDVNIDNDRMSWFSIEDIEYMHDELSKMLAGMRAVREELERGGR